MVSFTKVTCFFHYFKPLPGKLPYKRFHAFEMGTLPVHLNAVGTEIVIFIELQDPGLDQVRDFLPAFWDQLRIAGHAARKGSELAVKIKFPHNLPELLMLIR